MTSLTPGPVRPTFRAWMPVAALLLAAAPVAAAQITPPNIRKPIETARKVAGKTTEQIRDAEKAGGAGRVGEGAMQAQAATSADAQKAAPQRGGGQQKAAPRADSGAVSQAGRSATVTVYRETFAYNSGGRRDPFVSLMLSGELRPILTDLVLTGVIFDADPRRSVALVIDASTGESYRVRVGQTLGRMRVTRIDLERVTFEIDEFGLSRSETLVIDKSKKAGPPAAGRP